MSMFCMQAALPENFPGLDYSLDHHQHHHHQEDDRYHHNQQLMMNNSLDRMNFSNVMQFADFGPKLALNQTKVSEEESAIDPVYFLKFPVLNDNEDRFKLEEGERGGEDEEEARTDLEHIGFLGENLQKSPTQETKNKRKRPRSIKTSEEVESQRMTHIAVERNRRKQMNEHLRVLRALMPGSYVQRVN